jgi:hypothetical protein
MARLLALSGGEEQQQQWAVAERRDHGWVWVLQAVL